MKMKSLKVILRRRIHAYQHVVPVCNYVVNNRHHYYRRQTSSVYNPQKPLRNITFVALVTVLNTSIIVCTRVCVFVCMYVCVFQSPIYYNLN